MIGCSNAIYIDIVHDGVWQEGSYTLELSFDGQERSCDFVVPDDLPTEGRLASLDCGDGVRALLEPRCTLMVGNSGSGACTPIPDEYGLFLELQGNPKSSSVGLTRDGATILSDSRAPKYERKYPNGPDCDDGCSQGGYALTFED